MHRAPRPLLALGLALAAFSSAQAASVGHIPNELTDRFVVEPLKKADSVWDVFETLNGWLDEVYPKEGKARDAIDQFEKFIGEFQTGQADDPHARPRSVEMPLGVDRYLRLLRRESPGATASFQAREASNVKAQLYTAALLPFLHLRGIAYRLRPLVEHSYIMHSTAINALRRLKQDLRVRSGANGVAVFEFLTYPLAERKEDPVQFHKVSEFQGWLKTQFLPTMDTAIEIATTALENFPEGHKESLDLAIFMQAENPFPDATRKLSSRTFSRPEVLQFLARLHRYRAALRLACAYDLDDLPEVTNKVRDVFTRQYLRDKIRIGKKPLTGSPPVVRFHVVKKFSKFLTLKDGTQGPLALADLRQAWEYFQTAMDGYYRESKGQRDRIVNLKYIQVTESDLRTKVGPEIQAALRGPASLTDYVGGATVDVNLPGVLTSLPGDLKNFFPTEFEETAPYWQFEFTSGKLNYTNYDFGTPVGWNLGGASDSWKRFFPNIDTKPNADGRWDAPLKLYRDVSRTYLGGMIAPIMGAVVY